MSLQDRNEKLARSKYPTTANLSQFVKVPPVEDGNTPSDALNQGFIYTAESIDDDYYDTEYSSSILAVTSRRSTTNVGYVYEIVVEYTAKEAPTATTPGLYGSNLIKKGDFFIVTSLNDTHSYVKGAVVDILDVTTSGPVADVYTYEYNLLCNISDGDPLLIEVNDNFVWKRRIFTDASNELDNKPPKELLSTVKDDGVYFRWTDPTDKALKYNLRIREKNQSDGGGLTYYFLPGMRAIGNGEISLKVFLGSTGTYDKEITSIKIENPGDFYSLPPSVSIVGTGTGASVSATLNDSGSLKIDTYQIYDSNNTDEFRIESKDWQNSPELNLYVEGFGLDLFIKSYTSLGNDRYIIQLCNSDGSDFTFDSTFADKYMYKEIKLHSGIEILSGGSNYRRVAYTRYKEYLPQDIYYVSKGPSGTLAYGDYYWSVCGILSEDNKIYTEWTEEYPLTVK
jgi:hypothetical protein